MGFKEHIQPDKLPQHVAIIMDGNGRWAKQKGKLRTFGHKIGVKAVRETVEGAAEIGLKVLTLYAFSTENWNRPQREINALMNLLVDTIHQETPRLIENRIQLRAMGDLSQLPSNCQRQLQKSIDDTADQSGMILNLALSYSARWEILRAVKALAAQVQAGTIRPEDIDEAQFSKHLCTAEFPDPELLIRTSGEQRISNYLLWQIAYSELYFTSCLWPDFTREHLFEALVAYQQRERRFGKISEQVAAL
ncbi:MAG: isoprenyl transferase [Flavobacteriales bacterium]|jgi:undecaprenyl diphosphate synthase